MDNSFKKLVGRTAAAVAVCGLVASGMSLSASADPKQLDSAVKVGTGSDTTQDVLNALAGYQSGQQFTPVIGGPGDDHLISFDATGSTCITTKIGGPTFARPNGSSNGQRSLSRALDGGGWGASVAACGGSQDVSGQIDFARSSSGPSGTGSDLAFVPLGRDALSFAYYRASGAPVTDLTSAEITSIFTNGRTTINGVSILPCGIQTGSGTFASWNGAIGVSTAQEDAATAECNALLGRAQENDGVALKDRGDAAEAAVPGTQVIIGFSAGAFIAKSNGVASPTPPAGVEMGAIDGNVPVAGTGSNRTPVAALYNDPTYGRTVYNVVPAQLINSPGPTNLGLKGLFAGSGSAVCQATSTIETFGFLVDPNCGDTTSLIAPLRSGNG